MNKSYYIEEKSRRKWLVLIGSFFAQFMTAGISWGSTGVLQVTFMSVFGGPGKTGMISIITSLVPGTMACIGPFVSMLVNRFGCRTVTCMGGFLTACGFIVSSLAQSIWHLYCGFFIIGVGCGVTYIPAVVILCEYFTRHRAVCVALATSGVGVGIFVLPLLVRLLEHNFLWRGALLVMGGISLNICVAGCIFKPVWTPELEHQSHQKRKILRVKMLRHLPYICYLINNALVLFGVVAYFVHLPPYLNAIGFSEDESAAFVSVAGAFTTISRIACGFITHRFDAPIVIYVISMTVAGLSIVVTPFLNEASSLFITAVLFGAGSATIGPTMPLILAQIIGENAIADGYGYVMLAEGLGSLIGPPVVGALYDVSGSYVPSLCTSGFLLILGSVVMLQPLWQLRSHNTEAFSIARASTSDSVNENMHRCRSSTSDKPLLMETISTESESLEATALSCNLVSAQKSHQNDASKENAVVFL